MPKKPHTFGDDAHHVAVPHGCETAGTEGTAVTDTNLQLTLVLQNAAFEKTYGGDTPIAVTDGKKQFYNLDDFQRRRLKRENTKELHR